MELVRGIPITDYCDARAALDPTTGWSSSSWSARRCSTPTRRGSSTATSSPRTSWSRSTTACRCPRSSTSAWPRRPARASPTRRSTPASAQLVGTPLYMSPEQAELGGHRRRHPQRHLQPGRPPLRAADRHDAVRPGDAPQGGLRRDAADHPRARAARPSTRLSTLGATLDRRLGQPPGRPAEAGPAAARRARLDRDEGAGEGPRRGGTRRPATSRPT